MLLQGIKSVIGIGICLLSSLILTGCNDDRSQQSTTSASRLIIGTSADNPPFEFYTTSTDQQQIQGFDIDLMKEIAAILQKKAEFVNIDFNGLVPALQAQRIDVIASAMVPTIERQNVVDFSEIYITMPNAFITLAGIDMSHDNDLTNKKIGVQLGSTFELTMRAIAERISGITIVSRNRLGDLVQELIAGRIDGVLTEKSVAYAYIKNNSQLSVSLLQGYRGEFAIALPKNSPLKVYINDALTQLTANGKLDALKEKWLKTE